MRKIILGFILFVGTAGLLKGMEQKDSMESVLLCHRGVERALDGGASAVDENLLRGEFSEEFYNRLPDSENRELTKYLSRLGSISEEVLNAGIVEYKKCVVQNWAPDVFLDSSRKTLRTIILSSPILWYVCWKLVNCLDSAHAKNSYYSFKPSTIMAFIQSLEGRFKGEGLVRTKCNTFYFDNGDNPKGCILSDPEQGVDLLFSIWSKRRRLDDDLFG